MPKLPLLVAFAVSACRASDLDLRTSDGSDGSTGASFLDLEQWDADASSDCGETFLEGPFLGWGVTYAGMGCVERVHAFAGPAGASVDVGLHAWDGPAARLEIRSADGIVLASEPVTGAFTETFTLPWPGEFLVALVAADEESTFTYTLEVACTSGCETAYTRYPLVLLHGFGGTDSYLGLVDYFFGVEPELTSLGYAARAPAVDAFAPILARAEAWAAHLDVLRGELHARRFNLIAHSQGGLDARALVSVLGRADQVASITTVGTPHHGTPIADLALGMVDGIGASTIDGVASALSELLGLGPAELEGVLRDLTTVSAAAFNATTPDAEGVLYRSWGGGSCAAVDFGCQTLRDGEIVDVLLTATQAWMALSVGDNDGVVPLTSTSWGVYQGDLGADHFDLVGQISDGKDASDPFDHRAFYTDEARRLSALGL